MFAIENLEQATRNRQFRSRSHLLSDYPRATNDSRFALANT